MVEPAVQLERFRKDVEQLTWKKFQFDSNTPDLQDWDISLTEGVQNENIDDKSDSSSDSDTSSSDSLEAVRRFSWAGQPIFSMQFE